MEGTEVKLVFDQPLDSQTARVGDNVKLHVSQAVVVRGKTAIRVGTEATAVISQIGKSGNLQFTFNLLPIRTSGVQIRALDAGKAFKAISKSKAAGANKKPASGAATLVGNVLIPGKAVRAKRGDLLLAQIGHTVVLGTGSMTIEFPD